MGKVSDFTLPIFKATREKMRIFKNAKFISCEDSNRLFSVLAEENGKITYTGDEIPSFPGEHIDLNGKCVVPAFGDTHIHFVSFSYFNSGLDCRHAANFDELGTIINKHIGENPGEKVIVGFGCSAHTVSEKRLPDKDVLDKITSHPVMLVKYDGHASVANSALIGKLPSGVLKDKGFDRETGWFYQNAFYLAVNSITKSVSLPKVLKNLIGGSDYLARKGIALVHPAEGVGFPFDMDVTILKMAAGGLPQKFRIYFQTMDEKKVLRRKLPCIGGCFATALDGCLGSEDAALTEPYSNDIRNNGVLFYPQAEVDAFVKRANEKSLQVSMHAVGDRAIGQALDSYEKALLASSRKDHRHIIIHADLMNEEMIEKASKLGICIALQTPFLSWREEPLEYLEKILGKRLKYFMPLKSMLDAGIVMANGSDGPCTLPDPIQGIHAACNHFNPEQRISALDALKMHTSCCAKLSFDENERGTLTAGKIADFAVLSDNPLEVPVDRINSIKVEGLYLKGKKYEGQGKSAAGLLLKAFKSNYINTH